ncbi:MAG TPA: AAC(3) family N-acetyltransferase [Armatimonadota bacterium]|nr:AAC(3) family N-acetyltransferase [Armatimonadota bacterium]
MTDTGERTQVRQEDIERGLRQVGLKAGDVALVHSSLSAMGWVIGGADAAIDALLAVLDPERGTLVLPTLCQADKERRFETWDIERSPSDVGRITEVGRLRPDAIRSDHPTHSVAAIGARAAEITRNHATAHDRPSPWGPAAFGFGSPWEKLYQCNARYLFLGTTTSCNTLGHFAQAEFVRRALEDVKTGRDELLAEVRGWNRPGVWPSFGFAIVEEWLAERNAIHYAQVGDATLRATRARVNVHTIIGKLTDPPQGLLPDDFMHWYRRVKLAAQGGDRP